MSNDAVSKPKATHDIVVIRADGTREKVHERQLAQEDADRLWQMIKQQVETEEEKKNG